MTKVQMCLIIGVQYFLINIEAAVPFWLYLLTDIGLAIGCVNMVLPNSYEDDVKKYGVDAYYQGDRDEYV